MEYIVILIIIVTAVSMMVDNGRKGDITKMIERNKKRKHMEDMYGIS